VSYPKVFRTGLSAFLLLVIVLMTACSSTAKTDGGKPTSTPIPTAVAPVKTVFDVKVGDITELVQSSGRIAPVTQFSLFFRTDGRVRNVNVKEGDVVKKGQVLADLEVLNGLERRQASSQLSIRRAQIQLEMAKLELQMTEADAVINKQSVLQIPFKKYQVELAQISLDEVNLNNEDLSATVIDAQLISPIDGSVLLVGIEPGGTAAAFKEAVVVADVNTVEVSMDLDSTSQSKVDVGLLAMMTFPNRSDLELKGQVRKLPSFGAVDNSSGQNVEKTTRLSFDMIPSDVKFAIGERVDVKIVIQQKQGVLYLPPQAIRSFEDRKFVVILDGTNQKRMDIKVGIQSDNQVEILSGLMEGQVILAP
jgi:RND family efflux transporter MFP subunit